MLSRQSNHDSRVAGMNEKVEPVKRQSIHKHPQPIEFSFNRSVLPNLPERLQQLLNSAYALHSGPEFMKLSDWHDLELQLKQKLENEKRQCRG